MDDLESNPRCPRTNLLMRAVAVLGLALSAVGSIATAQTPASPAPPASEAARTAKKVKKAASKANAAGEGREALRHFREEVAEYDALHRKQLGRLAGQEPKAMQQALAQAILAKRPRAVRGDILGPEVEPLFRRLIAEQLQGPDAGAARKAVREGNPEVEKVNTPPVDVRVNAVYTVGAPLSTVPASVLLTLPELPKSLNYRFVGRDLLLVDSVAQLIVDFLPGAAPAVAIP